MRIAKMRYFFPIGLFLALILDGSLSHLFSAQFFSTTISVESRLVLLWLVMTICTCGDKVKHIGLWTAVAGLFFDMFYTGIIGVYVLILPVMVIFTRWIAQYFAPSFLVTIMIYLIDVTVMTVLSYGIYSFWMTNGSLVAMVAQTLGPTLAFNLAAFVVLYYPLDRFLRRYS